MSDYSFKIQKDDEYGFSYISLSYTNSSNPEKSIEASISPELGSNLFKFSIGNNDIIFTQKDLLVKKDFTGDFVLWPIPNRIKDRKYSYKGIEYSLENIQTPRGNYPLIHGLVFYHEWQFEEPIVSEDSVTLTTYIDHDENSPFYEGFPFKSRLKLFYLLSKDGLKISYTVSNKGDFIMPFGFALHPAFSTLSGMQNTKVSIPAKYVMEADDELLPSGDLLNVSGIMYKMFDLNEPVSVGNLKLDHIYTGADAGSSAFIDYRDQKLKLILKTSKEFTHFVIYTLEVEKGFICLENQTCSSDFLNLHNEGQKNTDIGLKHSAHLLEVEPEKEFSGFIEYKLECYS